MEKSKNKFLLWLENIWWKHKWMIICLTLIAVFVVISVYSSVTKKEPDYNLMYVGRFGLSLPMRDLMEEDLQDFMQDLNGDGSKVLQLHTIAATTEYVYVDTSDTSFEYEYSRYIVDGDKGHQTMASFNTEVTVGSSLIYLLPEYYYDQAKEGGYLAKLEDVLDEENMPENPRDEYSVYLKDMDFFALEGFNALSEDTIVCIRRFPNVQAGEILYGRDEEQYAAHIELFNLLFAYEK